MADEAALVEDLANELRVPDGFAGFRDIIETLPELHRMLAERYLALAEALSEQAGAAVMATVSALHELAGGCGVDGAEQVALAFDDESRFWRGGE